MKKICCLVLLLSVFAFGSCFAAENTEGGSAKAVAVKTAAHAEDRQAVSATDTSVKTDVNKGEKKMVKHIAVFETTMGNFKIELLDDKTPITVKNFIDLSKKGFYDGVIFHRVIDGFMIQGGDPDGTGMGGPGYTIEDEFPKDLTFTGEGILAMANTGMPHTGGSQFFITLAATPHLNYHHTIFGKVIEGMDVVRSIGHVDTDFNDRPLKDVVIKHIEIKEAE